MKRLLAIWLGLLAPWASAQTHVYFDLAAPFFNALPASNRVVTLQPLAPFPGNSITYTSSASGTFYHSNAFVGDYVGSIRARGLANEIKFQITVTSTNLGVVNADTITSLTGQQSYPSTGRASWSIQASDQRFVRTPTNAATANDGDVISKTGDKTKYVAPGSGSGVFTAAGTNVTAQTNGNVVTINADVSTASVAEKSPTNAPTLFSPVFQGHNIVLVSGNVQRPYASLALANAAATAGDTILVYGSNYVAAPVAPVTGVTIRGSGRNALLYSTGLTDPTLIVTNSNVTIEALALISDRHALGQNTAATHTVTNLTFSNLRIHGNTNAVLWRSLSGSVNNIIVADFWNCHITTATNSGAGGMGVGVHLASGGRVRLMNCVVFGDIDAALVGGVSGGKMFIEGGEYTSTLDPITSAGGDMEVRFAKTRGNIGGGGGSNGDLFQDDGTLTALWVDYETTDDGVVGNHRIPGGLLVSGTITNEALTASRVILGGAQKQHQSVNHTGIVLGDGTQAAAANVYGLWTGTGTYMTRFGTNANVSGGSGETNLQRVLQVGSNANGENATNFGTISATNATFENFNVENQYTTNHYVTSLTSGRVVLATTGGQLTDHSGFTYNTGTGNLGVQGSVTAESFAGDGSALTDLNATEITSGTLPNARLDSDLQTWATVSPTNSAASNKWIRATSTSTAEWTDLPAGSGDALTSNPLSQFAATTSAQLAGVLSDESGSGQALFTTGGATTNAHHHNPTNQWSNPSGTIKTLFSDNAGNPSLTFLGQSDTPQLSIYWENGTSGGINAPYINGNGSSISYNGAGNNGNLATSVNTLQELNDAVDNLSLGGGSQNLEQVLQDGSNANGQNATNFNLISATNATFENLEIENQYVTNHYVTSLTSGRVTYATTGGQLTDDAGFTYDSSGDRVSVGAANVTNSINLLGSSISNAVGIYGVDNSTTASNLTIQAGTTSGAGGTSGNLVLKTGGTGTGTAGSISLIAGTATSSSGTPGNISITAGDQDDFSGGTSGGTISISGGGGNTTVKGGNITIVPGFGDGAGYGTNIFGGITFSSKSWNYFIGTNQFTDDVVAQSRLKVTGPAQITNTIYQSFAVNELATTGNKTNFTVDFYATNTQTILATGNVYIASLDNLAAGRWKQLIITNVFKASSNITAYVQTNLLWLGPTNGYALGANPMHTNRAYPVTNVLVLSLQAVGSTAPSVLGYGIQSSP